MAQETREIWDRFDNLEGLTNKDLRILLKEVKAALRYLEARPGRYMLALLDARETERRLLGYAWSRGIAA